MNPPKIDLIELAEKEVCETYKVDIASAYPIQKDWFIKGATSKYVEKQKLEFAKTQLEKFRSKLGGYGILSGLLKEELEIQIYELKQKISEL